jgi:hypothetical protein
MPLSLKTLYVGVGVGNVVAHPRRILEGKKNTNTLHVWIYSGAVTFLRRVIFRF